MCMLLHVPPGSTDRYERRAIYDQPDGHLGRGYSSAGGGIGRTDSYSLVLWHTQVTIWNKTQAKRFKWVKN